MNGWPIHAQIIHAILNNNTILINYWMAGIISHENMWFVPRTFWNIFLLLVFRVVRCLQSCQVTLEGLGTNNVNQYSYNVITYPALGSIVISARPEKVSLTVFWHISTCNPMEKYCWVWFCKKMLSVLILMENKKRMFYYRIKFLLHFCKIWNIIK